MSPLVQRAIKAARAPELVTIADTLTRLRETIKGVQSACPHPLILESKWGVLPSNPHRICVRCGLEEVSQYISGGWVILTRGDGRDVEEVEEGQHLWAVRPPLGATFTR